MSQKPRHAARARPTHTHQLSRAHKLASSEHRHHRTSLRAQGNRPSLGEEWPERPKRHSTEHALCLSPRDRSKDPSNAGCCSWGRGSCRTFAKTSLNCER